MVVRTKYLVVLDVLVPKHYDLLPVLLAGDAHLTKGNARLVLSCSLFGHEETKTIDLGVGGRASFVKHESQFRRKGWK